MIGIWICPSCSLPSIKPLAEKDSDYKVCPSCGTLMTMTEERLEPEEKNWILKIMEESGGLSNG